MPEQLTLPFIHEIDRQAAEAREVKARRMKRANDIAILRASVRQYPLTNYERGVIPKGVRPARFVIGWEELQLVATATIPLMVKGCPFPEDITIGEGLLELAKIFEEGNE